jgi:hypothetical protein
MPARLEPAQSDVPQDLVLTASLWVGQQQLHVAGCLALGSVRVQHIHAVPVAAVPKQSGRGRAEQRVSAGQALVAQSAGAAAPPITHTALCMPSINALLSRRRCVQDTGSLVKAVAVAPGQGGKRRGGHHALAHSLHFCSPLHGVGHAATVAHERVDVEAALLCQVGLELGQLLIAVGINDVGTQHNHCLVPVHMMRTCRAVAGGRSC